jgi:hypothetical protein
MLRRQQTRINIMQNNAHMSDKQFLTYVLLDAAVFALKQGWSNKSPGSWTWTTRSELDLLAHFYGIAFSASEKITQKVQESLFEADLMFTKPEAAAKALWLQLENAFPQPWDKTLTQRMKVAKRVFEDRIRLIDKGLSPQAKAQTP